MTADGAGNRQADRFAEFCDDFGFGDDAGQRLDIFAALHGAIVGAVTVDDGFAVTVDAELRTALSTSHRLLCEALRGYRYTVERRGDGSQGTG